MADKIQLRRDIADNWTSADPILAQGEVGIETDTQKLKIGDGSTEWTSLLYYRTDASVLADLSDVGDSTPTNKNVLVADGTDWESRALVKADISDFSDDDYDASGTAQGLVDTHESTYDHDDIALNTSSRHNAVTVTDSDEIDFTLTGQDITASIKSGSIDVLKLDSGVQSSLGLADSALQSETDPVFTSWESTTDYLTDSDIGSSVQAYSSKLLSLAGLTPAMNLIRGDGLGSWETVTPANFITDNSIVVAGDDVSDLNNDAGYLTEETDPVFSASQASNITADDITNLGNLSGTNTGDQDLSGYVPYTGATTDVDLNGQNLVNLGNVGVGTDNPSNKLSVNGNADFTDSIGVGTSNITDIYGIDFDAPAFDSIVNIRADGNSEQARLIMAGYDWAELDFVDANASTDNKLFIVRSDNDEFQILPHTDIGGAKSNSNFIMKASDGSVGIGVDRFDALSGQLHVKGNIVTENGNIKIINDNQKLLLGAGEDASIYYDGTDLVIDPKEVGSGVVSVSGDVEVTDDAFAADWDADTAVPTKNAIYDAIRRKGFAAKNSTTSMSATTWTVPTFTTEIDDTDTAWDGTTFTVPTGMGGMWSISGMFTFASFSDGSRYIVGVEVNGGGTPSYTFLLGRGMSGATGLGGVGGNVKWELAAGDTVRMVVYCEDATSGYNADGYQSFSAYKLND